MIKIFLDNITTIDFAFLDSHSKPVGISLIVNTSFTGNLNANGMLIDFADAKSMLKSALEICDHKLLVATQNIKHVTDTDVYIGTDGPLENKVGQQHSGFFAMYAPKDWVCELSARAINETRKGDYRALSAIIEQTLKKMLPRNIQSVCVQLEESESDLHYTHTLCHHKGNCQRFHGHSSRIVVLQNKNINDELTKHLIQKIHGLYIISKQYLRPLFDSKHIRELKDHCFLSGEFEKLKHSLYACEYTGADGKVAIIMSKNNVLTLENESTIENIACFLHDQISEYKNTEVIVYEGTSKGSSSI